MKPVFSSVTGIPTIQFKENVHEYHLVLFPDKTVQDEIKEECYQLRGFTNNEENKLQPHIKIAVFTIKEEMEDTLSRWIQNICNLQYSFKVVLNNYSSIPPDTIYLRIQDSFPFQELSSRILMLNNFILQNNCPPLHLERRPHLVIADHLPPCVYEEAEKLFSMKTFYRVFIADKLVLVRNKHHQMDIINNFILPVPACI